MPNELIEDIQFGLFGPCNAGNFILCWITKVILHNLIVLFNASKWWDILFVYPRTNLCCLDLQWLWSVCSLGPLFMKFKRKHIMGTHGAHFKFT